MAIPTPIDPSRSAHLARAADALESAALDSTDPKVQDACYRSAISRAYYAAFHHVLDSSKTHAKPYHSLGGGNDHRGLPNWLIETQRRVYGNKLYIAHLFRISVDYHDKVEAYDRDPSKRTSPVTALNGYKMVSKSVQDIINNI